MGDSRHGLSVLRRSCGVFPASIRRVACRRRWETDRARGVYKLKKHSDPIVARTSALALRAIRYQLLDDFAIRATGMDASAIVQRENVVAVGSRFDVADVANIDDI